MDESPVVYKRRRSRQPLSELSWNIWDVNGDPEPVVSLLASEDWRMENVTPMKENVTPIMKIRKGWSDQPLPRKRTRSSSAWGEDLTLKDRTSKLFGTLFGRKGKDEGKGDERMPTPSKQAKDVEITTPLRQARGLEGTTPCQHRSTESPGGGRRVILHSPIEFVREKQALFAEIDAFELESEEEDPEENNGQEMETEIESLQSSKGENTGHSPTLKPEQSTQEVTSTKEVGEKN